MYLQLFSKNKTIKLATLITRAVYTVMLVVTLFVLFQNFQATSRAVDNEIERTRVQTNSLVQALFNLELTSLRSQQDSYSRNDTLVHALNTGYVELLDEFFANIDELNPQLTPDFRYIIANEEISWGDNSYTFFGIEEESLIEFSHDLTRSNNWHLVKTPSLLGTKHLLIRRTPIVDSRTGEVLAMYYIGTVLNQNYSLIDALKADSNSDSAIMVIDGEVIASTIVNQNTAYTEEHVLTRFAEQSNSENYIVIETPLKVSGSETSIVIYAVQQNLSAAAFLQHYNFLGRVLLIFMLILGAVTWYWFNKRVSLELASLTQYTTQAVTKRNNITFTGSPIKEFDQIGHTLESALKRLTEQEKQFEDLFNFSLSPILFWSVDGRVKKINPAAERHFSAFKAQDETYQQLVDNLFPQIKMAAQGATLTGVNIPIGEQVFRWNLSPVILDEEVKLVIAQSQDITSLIAAEKQSELARVEAEELARVRADFLAKMSHELRTPLNGILGVSQLLRDSSIDAKMLENVNVLCNSGEHLLAVLNDILDFSKMDQGKYSIQVSEFDPIETHQAVDKIFSSLCNEKGVEFIITTDFSQGTVISTDKVRLTQILFNLTSNAVKFTHKGTVKVALTHSNKGENSTLHIAVSDTGIGIEEAYIDRVFEPFVQASESTAREYGGSGLGLTIIKNLVEILGGEYQIRSEFGVGTSFTVDLPIRCIEIETVAEQALVAISPESLFDRELNVLLVEDNHTNAFIARAFCEKYGMNITWVKDGQEAIDEVKRNTFDLILMDNQLPKVDGVEATRIIREELNNQVPIFACTADGHQDTRQDFMSAGANDIILKPIKEHELYQAFENLKKEYL
ncbi:response regulator [Vibrio sp. ZSDE26]|uniref:Autoinducer 2 sensor kinase/phosphatase LuxQ n=1 Tax=Vibrio amylolyticus TaxID=2847292 RepID=A0A9X2BLF4_9VIBR|nr:quorum-sensing autoinducer 2 sensor kinase/phosphatase LuxQ [Vibrio amylolyticus]MCK6263873.1 response regulator [Vibrio amylolyticus]